MCNFFRHLESEMQWCALGKRQIRCKEYASCGNIQRLRCVLWGGRLCDADAKRNFEAESFGKASFGSSHGNDIPLTNKGALGSNRYTYWRSYTRGK
jgi:hypothetical protein